MRGNGAVLAGDSLEMAVVLAWYLEDAARVELDCLASGVEATAFSADQSAARAIWSGRLLERMWDYMSPGDPELPACAAVADTGHTPTQRQGSREGKRMERR